MAEANVIAERRAKHHSAWQAVAPHVPSLFGMEFADKDKEKRYQLSELATMRTLGRMFFMAGVVVFVLYASINAFMNVKVSPLSGGAPNISHKITYALVNFCPMIVGLTVWLLLTYWKPTVRPIRHYCIVAMNLGLAVVSFPMWAWDEDFGCSGNTVVRGCAAILITAFLLFQMLVGFFIPLIARVSFISHWPMALFREITMLAMLRTSLVPIQGLDKLFIGVSACLEIIGAFIVYLQEKGSRTAFDYAEQVAEERERTVEFLSLIMHEVRNPLNAVTGNCELLKHSRLTVNQAECVADMYIAAQQMKNVVSDVLDMHKAQAGRMLLEQMPLSALQVARAAVAQVRVNAESKSVNVKIMVSNTVPGTLFGDPSRLTQMLANYCSNAVKFTPANGQIVVLIHAYPSTLQETVCIRWTVIDNGEGFDSVAASRLFQSYSQASAAVARQHGGTGLGLTIVRQLADLMRGPLPSGGGVGAVSCPRVGSVFHFDTYLRTLPPAPGALTPIRYALQSARSISGKQRVRCCFKSYRMTPELPDEERRQLARIVDAATLTKMCEELMNLPSTTFSPDSTRDSQNDGYLEEEPRKVDDSWILSHSTSRILRILVADDDRSQTRLLQVFLRSFGWLVTAVKDGAEALKELKTSYDAGRIYDVVTLDINMSPGLGGIPTAQQIREWERSINKPPTPLLAVSASVSEAECRSYFAAGFDDIVAKPFSKQQIRDSIIKVFFKRSILVVDDSDVNRRMLQRMLERAGHRVAAASSVEAAISLYLKASLNGSGNAAGGWMIPFHAVLTDMNFGTGMTGVDLARAFRTKGISVPIFAVTGSAAPELESALQHGDITRVFIKPIVSDELLQALAAGNDVQLPSVSDIHIAVSDMDGVDLDTKPLHSAGVNVKGVEAV